LKVLEKYLKYVEILHLVTVLKQTLVCISPVLAFSLLAYLTNSHCNLSPACIITVLVSTVQHTSVAHCSLNFAAPRVGYGFLSIILVLENCKFRSLKVLEKSLNFVL